MGNNNDNFGRFPRLKGSENWEAWSIRMRALLTREKLVTSISSMANPSLAPLANVDQAEHDKYDILISQYLEYVLDYQDRSYQAVPHIRLGLEDGFLYQTQHIEGVHDL